MNYLNSSKEHEGLVNESSYEEPCILETDMICIFSGLTGDEQKLDNVLMHVEEEVKLFEEIVEIEGYFEHVFNTFENDGIDREIVMIKEVEDKQMEICDDNQNKVSSVENPDSAENVKECMMMLTNTELQEFCDFKELDICGLSRTSATKLPCYISV